MTGDLHEINFGKNGVLHYVGSVDPKFRLEEGLAYCCEGFCCSCEENKKCLSKGGDGVLMSHGCTGADIAKAMGLKELPVGQEDRHVMFVFENPGADYGQGIVMSCGGVTKKPPVKHYYWTSDMTEWPDNPPEKSSQLYGGYIAYLMTKHKLRNVYVTNCIKCKYVGGEYSATAQNCMEHIFKAELTVFRPDIIFCFGARAHGLVKSFLRKPGYENVKVKRLLHPAQRRYKRELYFEKNDCWVSAGLNEDKS